MLSQNKFKNVLSDMICTLLALLFIVNQVAEVRTVFQDTLKSNPDAFGQYKPSNACGETMINMLKYREVLFLSGYCTSITSLSFSFCTLFCSSVCFSYIHLPRVTKKKKNLITPLDFRIIIFYFHRECFQNASNR